tara:strand:- start:356 stop:628 length:273 start_codon:yes stop_codon:yes gene_type:complete
MNEERISLGKWKEKSNEKFSFYCRENIFTKKPMVFVRYNFYSDIWELIILIKNCDFKIREFGSKLDAALFCDIYLLSNGYNLKRAMFFPY